MPSIEDLVQSLLAHGYDVNEAHEIYQFLGALNAGIPLDRLLNPGNPFIASRNRKYYKIIRTLMGEGRDVVIEDDSEDDADWTPRGDEEEDEEEEVEEEETAEDEALHEEGFSSDDYAEESDAEGEGEAGIEED